jgi:hypothetical protein
LGVTKRKGEKNMAKEKEQTTAVPEKKNEDLELYGKLRNAIDTGRTDFKSQLAQVKEAIDIRTQELETLKTKKDKLLGAIEASDIYLKAVLKPNQ